MNKFSQYTDEQKQELKDFLKANPSGYDKYFDWSRPDKVTYEDFEKAKDAKMKSKSQLKKVNSTKDYKELFDRTDILIHGEDEKYIYVSPLSYEACIWINSVECGYGTAQWCIGYQNDDKYYKEYMSQGFAFILAFRKDFKDIPQEQRNKILKYMIQINPFIERLTLNDEELLRAGASYDQTDNIDYANSHSFAVLNKIKKDSLVIDVEGYSISQEVLKKYAKNYWKAMLNNLPYNKAEYYRKEKVTKSEVSDYRPNIYKEEAISHVYNMLSDKYGNSIADEYKKTLPYICSTIREPDFIWDVFVDLYDNDLKQVIESCLSSNRFTITKSVRQKVEAKQAKKVFEQLSHELDTANDSIFIKRNIIKHLVLDYGNTIEVFDSPSLIKSNLYINDNGYLYGANGHGIVLNYRDYEEYKDLILTSDVYLSGTLGDFVLAEDIKGLCNCHAQKVNIEGDKHYKIFECYIGELITNKPVTVINSTIEKCYNYPTECEFYNSNIN